MKILKILSFLFLFFAHEIRYSSAMETPNNGNFWEDFRELTQDLQSSSTSATAGNNQVIVLPSLLNPFGDINASMLSSNSSDVLNNSQGSDSDMSFTETEETTRTNSPTLPVNRLVLYALTGNVMKLTFAKNLPIFDEQINAIDPSTGYTPLMAASVTGNKEALEILLSAVKINPNLVDNYRYRTALYFAIENQHKKCARILISNPKTDLELTASTPPLLQIIKTRYPKYLELAKFIIEHGADTSITDKTDKNKPLLILILNRMGTKVLTLFPVATTIQESESDFELISFFISQGINLLYKNSENITASDLLNTILKNIEHAELKEIFEKIINSFKKENIGIHTATASGIIDRMKKLIQKNPANLDLPNLAKNTPLHLAVLNNQKQAIIFLLKRKANINAQNIRGKTPLHLAVQKGFSTLCLILIQQGADLEKKDLNGKTPILIAKESDNTPLFIFLTKLTLEKSPTNCSICMSEIEYGENYLIFNCGHCFHEECACNFGKLEYRCPNCRSLISNPSSGKCGEFIKSKKRKHKQENPVKKD